MYSFVCVFLGVGEQKKKGAGRGGGGGGGKGGGLRELEAKSGKEWEGAKELGTWIYSILLPRAMSCGSCTRCRTDGKLIMIDQPIRFIAKPPQPSSHPTNPRTLLQKVAHEFRRVKETPTATNKQKHKRKTQ